jgi:CDP-glycerol glycerophosphotransferase (TagB/SpsB family)
MRELFESVIREIDRTLKLYLAFLITRLSGKVRAIQDQRCWLIGGMSGKAYADNSAALHHYLVENCPDLKVYWVINRDSPDVDRVKRIGPVLYREALRTYVYGLLAHVQVISHGLADVPTCGSSLSKGAVKVRLGHGLTALKKTKASPLRSVRAKNRVFDLVPVSSEFERQNKLSWGIAADSLAVTGLPRFDELVRKSELYRPRQGADHSPVRILYMPTWRDWLPRSTGRFVGTDFYRQVTGFLLHPALNEALTRHNVFLYVHFHIIAQRHLAVIGREIADLSHIKVLSPDADLQDALARSRLLITDYSSVAWDFLYLDRPVLFYQFDVEKFNEHRGAYIDLHDLFGPIAREAKEAVALTGRLMASRFDPAPYRTQMDHWQSVAFRYRDARNCERVVDIIRERLRTN